MLRRLIQFRRGAVAVMAMLFLVLLSTLSVAMFQMASVNTASAASLQDAARARAAAESGLRWAVYEFSHMSRPLTTIGQITPAVAITLWPSIVSSFQTQLNGMLTPSERTVTSSGTVINFAPISMDTGETFTLTISQYPAFSTLPATATPTLLVNSVATVNQSKRTASMQFTIDKKVNFAVVGKVEVQIGKNTLVEGPVGVATLNYFPPVITLSDFKHLTTSLDSQINNFEAFLKANHQGYDGRIAMSNPTESAAALAAGYSDVNGDGYIDEYDLFLAAFDKNGDKQITQSEFTNSSTGQLYDAQLDSAIDRLGGPLTPTAPIRAGYKDGIIANDDGYAKIRGQVLLADTAASWASNLASQGLTINDMFAGPIIPPNTWTPPVVFGAPASDFFDLTPSDFSTASFAADSGPNNGTASSGGTTSNPVYTNKTLSSSLANGGTVVNQTPYGSTSWEATYQRPVFQNATFNNCTIPQGLNALFENCTFTGTTYVQLTTNITDSSGNTTTSASAGMTWSEKMKSGSFTNNTVLTASNSYGFTKGNNLRFDNCTIQGPIASDVPTAYTHFANSWEFTGSTMFDLSSIPVSQQTATIVAPQTNIEMGSFQAPTAAPSTLVGVVVVGNIDIRGTTLVDGSLIVTGDGAANTTLGWFGPSDGSSDPNSVPTGGFGKINLRYNPNRALPNGINCPIQFITQPTTYTEG